MAHAGKHTEVHTDCGQLMLKKHRDQSRDKTQTNTGHKDHRINKSLTLIPNTKEKHKQVVFFTLRHAGNTPSRL